MIEEAHAHPHRCRACQNRWQSRHRRRTARTLGADQRRRRLDRRAHLIQQPCSRSIHKKQPRTRPLTSPRALKRVIVTDLGVFGVRAAVGGCRGEGSHKKCVAEISQRPGMQTIGGCTLANKTMPCRQGTALLQIILRLGSDLTGSLNDTCRTDICARGVRCAPSWTRDTGIDWGGRKMWMHTPSLVSCRS